MPPYHETFKAAMASAIHEARRTGNRHRVFSRMQLIGWAICPRRVYYVRQVSA